MLLKQKSPSLPRDFALGTFQELLIMSSKKVNRLIAKLFAKNFSNNFYLNDSGISLTVFPSRTNLKLDSSKVSGPHCIPVVVLKNCESELLYIPAELFNMCLKVLFSRFLEVSSVVSVFQYVGERSTAKNYCPVSLLKSFKKLVNNRIVDHLEKCGLFSDFQYGFRSS